MKSLDVKAEVVSLSAFVEINEKKSNLSLSLVNNQPGISSSSCLCYNAVQV